MINVSELGLESSTPQNIRKTQEIAVLKAFDPFRLIKLSMFSFMPVLTFKKLK